MLKISFFRQIKSSDFCKGSAYPHHVVVRIRNCPHHNVVRIRNCPHHNVVRIRYCPHHSLIAKGCCTIELLEQFSMTGISNTDSVYWIVSDIPIPVHDSLTWMMFKRVWGIAAPVRSIPQI